jgi:hypothetical protein
VVIFKDAANVDSEVGDSGTGTPQQQSQVRSALDLPHHFEWDGSLDYVGRLAAGIPAHMRMDMSLGWRIKEHLDVSAVGQNLLSPRHAKSPDDVGVRCRTGKGGRLLYPERPAYETARISGNHIRARAIGPRRERRTALGLFPARKIIAGGESLAINRRACRIADSLSQDGNTAIAPVQITGCN